MQFWSIALITLWTLIAGPVFDRPPRAGAASRSQAPLAGALAAGMKAPLR
jgi:hypothetical protein